MGEKPILLFGVQSLFLGAVGIKQISHLSSFDRKDSLPGENMVPVIRLFFFNDCKNAPFHQEIK